MSQAFLFPRYDKATETIINPISNISIRQTLVVGNSTDATDQLVHVQGTQATTIFLEADTDDTNETQHPEIVATQDGGNTGFKISNIDDDSVNIDLIDIPGTNNVDFKINSTAATNNGVGNPPTIGARTNLMTVHRDGTGVDIPLGGIKFPNMSSFYLNNYDYLSFSGAWTGSAGTWGGSTITVGADVEIIGRTVSLVISQHIGALQNAGTIVSPAGFVPAVFRPAVGHQWSINVFDGAANQQGLAVLSSAGTITIYGTAAAGNFTGAAANAGWSFAFTLCWNIATP